MGDCSFHAETPSTTPASKIQQQSPPQQQSAKNDPSLSKIPLNSASTTKDDDGVMVTDDDDDLVFDEEEFENSESEIFENNVQSSKQQSADFKIAQVPVVFTGNLWEAYPCEALMIAALLGYLINFLIGRTKNSNLATVFYNTQRNLLEKNFTVVGDNGQTKDLNKTSTNNLTDEQSSNNSLVKESENLYVLWCSGRIYIESMLVELRFIKRQCLFNLMASVIKSVNDTVVYTIDYSKDDIDTFVFCLARKRCAAKLHRDMNDLSQFCSERKSADKRGLGANYQLLNEIGEVATTLIDSHVTNFIDRFPEALEYIHVSDQYTGTKNADQQQPPSTTNTSAQPSTTTTAGSTSQQQDALNTSERSVRRVLTVAFNIKTKKDQSIVINTENTIDYLRLVLHLIERIHISHFSLSKESKLKANKNRQRVEEQFLKSVYQQRQEQAQQRREEKRRQEKEKIMQDNDPEKQRKWEEKEHKREMKRKQPKMKQMKTYSDSLMAFLPGTHRFLDPKCNQVLDDFYDCVENKSRLMGNCDNLLIKMYKCKKEDLEAHRQMNRAQTEKHRREQAIARDGIIQEKLKILNRLKDRKAEEEKQKGNNT
ncbi:unnamed protein product [Didymodactylos carnosus]|uniref:PAT complex subunit CCDC47 n=1 Tax=Didymodactylos carnosus TaxID=1234261 RepID=A0A813SGL2_9BILA|nr:unnamed protein product [Didymodactylos carnosus]CAF3579245.1 unnamed protein product [Didymodactylos carnosus]